MTLFHNIISSLAEGALDVGDSDGHFLNDN